MTTSELTRRKAILLRWLGQDVQLKRAALRPNDPLRGRSGHLLEVNRTRVLVAFPTEKTDDGDPVFDEWRIPIASILLPGSTEPAPGQRELFDAEGGQN